MLSLGSRLCEGAKYQLEPRLEQMLVERSPAGRGAWTRLFDETRLKFPFQGGEVSEAEILNQLTDKTLKFERKPDFPVRGDGRKSAPVCPYPECDC